MKPTLLLPAMALWSGISLAQTDVSLAVVHQVDDAEFALNSTFVSGDSYEYTVTRLEYYLSEIEIVHDGGQITPVPDTWLLIDASGPSLISLGEFAVNEIEGINFSVGVNPEHNHLDPATYPAEHPLAPQNPSMHWGWASGYRFAAFEGLSGPGFLSVFEIHALGNDNYHQTQLTGVAHGEGNSKTIVVNADYNGLLQGVNVSGGLVVHGETQHAALLLDNFRDHVFSLSSEPLSIEGALNTLDIPRVYPNPFNAGLLAIDNLPWGNHVVEVLAMDGRVVYRKESTGSTERIDLETLENGSYLIRISGNRSLSVSRLIVAR